MDYLVYVRTAQSLTARFSEGNRPLRPQGLGLGTFLDSHLKPSGSRQVTVNGYESVHISIYFLIVIADHVRLHNKNDKEASQETESKVKDE